MSCDHCAHAIRTEIGKLPGVADVDVDVAAEGADHRRSAARRPRAA